MIFRGLLDSPGSWISFILSGCSFLHLLPGFSSSTSSLGASLGLALGLSVLQSALCPQARSSVLKASITSSKVLVLHCCLPPGQLHWMYVIHQREFIIHYPARLTVPFLEDDTTITHLDAQTRSPCSLWASNLICY